MKAGCSGICSGALSVNMDIEQLRYIQYSVKLNTNK